MMVATSNDENSFFFDESLLRELSENFLDNFDSESSFPCSSHEDNLQFFNSQQVMMTTMKCQCERGFELNNNSKVSRPRGAPFSIYVNDKLIVNISDQWLIENGLAQSSVSVSLKTFLFEDVSLLDSIEDYSINLDQAKLINNQLQVTIPIRRDNTTRRKTRKTTAKSIKGEETADDLEKKRKMRRSLNQEATKKVSYIEIIANQQVLATSQNMWCRSKTRSEMEKKKERQEAKKTSTPKRNTKRKQLEELIPLEIDQQMLDTHLNSAKRAKKQTIINKPVEQQSSDEEIPAEWFQTVPDNWQETFGVTCVDGTKQLQTVISDDSIFLPEYQELASEDFSCMFQEAFPSPNSTEVMPPMGINLDDMDWSNLFTQNSNTESQQQSAPNNMISKPICLDDFDLWSESINI